MNGSLGSAAGMGLLTGMRSFTPLALVARELASDDATGWWRSRRASRLEEWLSEPVVARALQVLAVGELIGDKLPGIPDRVTPGPLAGRATLGAVVGAVVAGEDQRVAGAIVGTVAAVAGAFIGWWARREAGRVTFLPDPALALAEDAVVVSASREIARQL